jgi:DNA-binding transcriptional LysR family regulator
MRNELPHLATFVKAAELNNFTAAARALGLTQAAISQHVHALEQELGVALFRRRGGRELTDAGRTLHQYACRIHALHQEARERVGGQKPAPAGDLDLAASSVPGEHLLPGLLAPYQHRYPHVRIKVTIQDTQAVLDLVERGKVHLGLVGGKNDNPDLEYRCFACDEMVLVVPAGHRWGRRKRVTLDELRDEPLVLREAGSGSRWCLEQALSAADLGVKDLKVALELGSNEAIKEAVQRGMGAAFLSRQAVRKELDAGALHALDVAALRLDREFFLVRNRRRVLPAAAQLFLDSVEPCPKSAG